MPSFAGLTKFFGKTASEGAAFAAGVAVAPALSPVVREIVNEANSKYATHPLSAGEAAAIVAEDVDSLAWGEQEARFNGISPGRFDRLWREQLNAPDVATLRTMWRRGEITAADFEHGLRKAKLEHRWDDAERALKDERLDPAVVAVAIQRGIIPDPGILPIAPPTEGGKVPAFPVFPVDAEAEAAAAGIDKQRLSVMVGNVGLPASAQQAASAYFRGIIERADFDRAIAEGNTRNEWRDTILEQARAIPSVTNYVEAFVRGWITKEQMQAGAARHGMTADDAEIEFLIHGRPLSWHQVFIGLRRGGVYDGPTGDIDPAFLKALRESNIRPEWYNLAWAQRFTYPAAFVLRALATDGDLTADETETILLYEGWEPGLAHKVATKWAGGGGGTASTPATTANKAAIRAVGKSYTQGRHTRADAEAELATLGVDQAEWPALFQAWDVTREATVKGLTPAQVKRAFKAGRYTETEAIAALVAQGYTAADATTYLES